jgi:hypothetical protein
MNECEDKDNPKKTEENMKLKIVVVVLLVCLLGACSGLTKAYAQEKEGKAERLKTTVLSLWFDGATRDVCGKLVELSGEQDETGTQALFHLGCALVMMGDFPGANKVLLDLEQRAGGEGKPLGERLRRLLSKPAGAESQGLNAMDLPIPEILRQAAMISGKAVVVDGKVSNKRLTLVLPKVDLAQVVKVLSELAPIEARDYGDIMLITPREDKVEAPEEKTGKISIDLKDVDVRDALRLIAKKNGMNLVFHRRVAGRVTVQLKNVDPGEAMKIVARANDLHLEPDGNCFLVVRIGDITEVTGKTDHVVVPLRFLEAEDALHLLQSEGIAGAEADGKSIVLKGDPEKVKRAHELLVAQDQPRKAIILSLGLWEPLPGKEIEAKVFSTLSPEKKAELARLILAPRVVTLPGRKAKIEVGRSPKRNGDSDSAVASGAKAMDKDNSSQYSFSLLPRELKDGLIQIDLQGELEMTVRDGEKTARNLRRISSSFVINPGSSFAYDIQGGSTPLIMEISVSRPD